MKKVISINLNGRAYQLEEPAYETLHKYLEQAKKSLATDPDQAEILTDLEQSIADKCDHYLTDTKNVVTESEAADTIAAMGPVHTGDESAEAAAETTDEPRKFRKLYRIREGAVFLGVCNGLAAAMGVPVGVVRALFFLLALLSHGTWVIAYLVAALIIPVAKTEKELAEAFGKPVTANEVVSRAKDRISNPEMRTSVGMAVMKLWQVLSKVVIVILAALLVALTAGWVALQWVVGLNRVRFQGNLAELNGWKQWVAITAVYLLLAIPLFLAARVLSRIADEKPRARRSTVGETTLVVTWVVALATIVSLSSIYASDVRDYVNAHGGHLDISNHHLCVNRDVCSPDGSTDGVKYNYHPAPPLPPVATPTN